MQNDTLTQEDKVTLVVTRKQCRLLYYALVKSGMGNTEVEHARELLQQIDQYCDNP